MSAPATITSRGEVDLGSYGTVIIYVLSDGSRAVAAESIGIVRGILAQKDAATDMLLAFLDANGIPSTANIEGVQQQ